MATADLDFTLEIKGTPDEAAALLGIMSQYDSGKDGIYFSFTKVSAGGNEISLSENDEERQQIIADACESGAAVTVTANGPFGHYGVLDEVDIFREMAEAAPGAVFTGSITGSAGYADQTLNARLENGRLHVSSFYLSDDVHADAGEDFAAAFMPYEDFVELLGLDSEEFDEDSYVEFMLYAVDCSDSPAEFFRSTDYMEFLELVEDECSLSEEEYAQAAEQLAESDCPSFEDFLRENDYAECGEYIYDPAEKKYISGKPVMKSGTVYTLNDTIRSFLEEMGLPCDDDAVNSLSVDDVYAILAGTYGKGDDHQTEDEPAAVLTQAVEDEAPADEDKTEEAAGDASCGDGTICTDVSADDSADEAAADGCAAEADAPSPAAAEDSAEPADKPADAPADSEISAEESGRKPLSRRKKAARIILLLLALALLGAAAVYTLFFSPVSCCSIEQLTEFAAGLL